MFAVLMPGVLGQILPHTRFCFRHKREAKMGIDALDRANGVAREVMVIDIMEAALRSSPTTRGKPFV